MNKQKKLKNLIREVKNLVFKFFKAYGLRDEILTIPKNVKKMGFKVGIMNLVMTIISLTIQHIFEVFEMASVVIMLIVAILTNTSINQVIFIPLILVFVLISFFSSAYISLNREEYYRRHREYNSEQSLIINDLLRVPVIVKNDLDMRIGKFQKTVIASNEEEVDMSLILDVYHAESTKVSTPKIHKI